MAISRLAVSGLVLIAGLAVVRAARADVMDASAAQFAFPSTSATLDPLDVTASEIGATEFTTGAGAAAADVTVQTTASQGVVQGSAIGLHLAPEPFYIAPYAGAYLSTGFGSIDIRFAAPEAAFGLLWGSVDPSGEGGAGLGPNALTFKSKGRTVATYTSDDMRADAVRLMGADVSFGGLYAILTDAGGSFDEVVLSSAICSFEAADLVVTPVPGPAAWPLLAGGALALTALRRRAPAFA